MKKIRIDGVEYEVDDKVAAAYEAAIGRADGQQTRADTATTRADQAQGREDALRTQLTTVQGELTTAKEQLAAANDPAKRADSVKSRVALERSAVKVLGEKERFDGLSDRELREKAILAVDKTAKAEDLKKRSDDYVTGQFDVLVVNVAGKRNDGMAIVQSAITSNEQTRADDAKKQDEAKNGEATLESRLDAAVAKLNGAGQPAGKVG